MVMQETFVAGKEFDDELAASVGEQITELWSSVHRDVERQVSNSKVEIKHAQNSAHVLSTTGTTVTGTTAPSTTSPSTTALPHELLVYIEKTTEQNKTTKRITGQGCCACTTPIFSMILADACTFG